MKAFQFARITVLGIAVSTIFAGCATTTADSKDGPAAARVADWPSGRVSFRHEPDSLGAVVRAAGEQFGGGMVLMAGLEEHAIGAIKIHKSPYDALARAIADEAGLLIDASPDYFFLYPAGYESLTPLEIGGALNAVYAEVQVSASFGAGTKLYNVFAVLAHMQNLTIVADNVVAETVCGEMVLAQAPLKNALEAILKSARLRPDAIVVESTEEFIFIRSAANQQPDSTLLNAEMLTDTQRNALDKRVTAYLPEAPAAEDQLYVYRAAKSLRGTTDTLARQIGVTVHADKEIEALPVNPVVLRNVRLGTALDLLIRQWPLPEFGYEFREDGICIRRR